MYIMFEYYIFDIYVSIYSFLSSGVRVLIAVNNKFTSLLIKLPLVLKCCLYYLNSVEEI